MPDPLDRRRERFRADPSDSRTFETLEEQHFLAGDWDGLAELYRTRIGAPALADDARARAQLWFRLGQIHHERRGDPESAIECYRQALVADLRLRQALRQLRLIHGERGQWELALQISETELKHPMAAAERAELCVEIGTLWLERLGDPELARDHFEQALSVAPESTAALRGVALALEALEAPQSAANAWERLAPLLQGPERAAAEMALARLVGGPLGDMARVVEIARRALTHDPRNPEAIEALSQHATAKRQWPLLADLLERRFELTGDLANRVGIALEAARVEREQLDNPAAAAVWLARAGELAPDDPDVAEGLAELARLRGDEEALRVHLDRAVTLRGDGARVSLLLEAASLHSARGGDERALEHLERAVGLAPGDALVAEALSDTLTRLGRWSELAERLRERAERADGEAAAEAWSELAQLREQRLGDPAGAIASYERALEALPSAPDAVGELERLYRSQQRWEALRGLLERAARAGPPASRTRALCALGELLCGPLERPAEAERAYDAALEIDPKTQRAHLGLQQLAARSDDPEARIRAFEREAEFTSDPSRLAELVGRLTPLLEAAGRPAQALEWGEHWMRSDPDETAAYTECARLHEALGHDAELVELLEKLDPLLDESERAANWRRLAAHHAARGRPDAAIGACASALEADPADPEALAALVGHLEEAGRFDELARARRRHADLLPPPERVRQLDALATLLAERLDDAPGAIEVLQRLAGEAQPPDDLDARLESLLERSERWEELAAQLGTRLARSSPDTPETRALALRRAGLLLDPLSRFDEAAAAFRAVLADSPGLEEARAGLERALRAAGDPRALVGFLEEEAASAPDAERRARAALERAILLEESLGRSDDARTAYAELADGARDPEVAERAHQRLEALLERVGAWAALREHLEAHPAEGEAEIARRGRLARLCRDRLDDAEAAVAHLEAAAALAPGRAEPWRELAGLYEAAERSDDLARALEAELATGPGAARERTLRARAAELCAGPLDDAERGRRHYERLLELDPTDPAASEHLIGHWQQQGQHDAVVAQLRRQLAALEGADGEAEQRHALRLRIAEVCAGPLGDLGAAIAELEPLEAEVGPRPWVSAPLCALYERAERDDELLALCRRTAGACDSPAEAAAWFSRLGGLLRRSGEPRRAIAAYDQVLERNPDDRPARAALLELYRELDEVEPLARLLEAELEQGAAGAEVALRLELAELLAEALERPVDAFAELRRVLQLEPDREDVLERALTLTDRIDHETDDADASAENAARTLDLLEIALTRTPDASRRADLLARRALCLPKLGRGEEASAACREALALDPERGDIRRLLRELLEGQERWEALLDCVLAEAQRAPDGSRAALFEEAAGIAAREVSAQAALPWLERLRAERPLDPGVPARIAALHREAGRWEGLLRALDDELEVSEEAPRRCVLYVEKARVLESRFQSVTRAADALESARREQPDDREILQALARLYRRCGRARERADALEALLRGAGDEERVQLHRELASLYTAPLDDPTRAVRHWLHAVAATPSPKAARAELLAALGEALRASCHADAWARCAEEELRTLDPEAPVFRERRRELRAELARVYEKALGRPAAALPHWRALVDEPAAPDDPGAGRALDQAEAALLRLLRAQRGWLELERRLAARLARQGGDAGAWLELARLREEHLHALPEAAEAWRRVLELDPGCLAAVRGLRGVAERLGEWNEVAATLDRELARPGTGARGALLRRLGDVCWRQLGSTPRASSAYAAALEADPGDTRSLHSLQQLLETMEDWRGALALYESEIEMLGDDDAERRSALWIRVAEITRDRTDDPERARQALLCAGEAAALPLRRRRELAELHERCGDAVAFVEVFAGWCDAEESGAGAAEQLRLGEALEHLERRDEAELRVGTALELDPERVAAWDALARLREADGDGRGAADALRSAAALVPGADAAGRLLRGASLIEASDVRGATELLRTAAIRDPGSAPVLAQLACASQRLERHDEAVVGARRALDLRDALGEELRLQVALAGGRSARALGQVDEAARFFSEALGLAPEHPEALAGYGTALAEQEDFEEARRVLEVRVGQESEYPERALHLAIVGRALESSGDLPAAAERYEAALASDPGLGDVHARLCDLYERDDRIEPGLAALERWAELADAPEARAQRLLRAALWELRRGGLDDSAERHLREILDVAPGCTEAWETLAELLWSRERPDEALEVATRGLDALALDPPSARLARVRARALERRGERREAAEAFVDVSRSDPGCVDAALSAARLMRGLGDWRGAAGVLERFDERNPEPRPDDLAEVLHQLARLRAGPLEDMDGALARLRRAVDLAPERRDVRAALARLLSHRPETGREALAQLRVLLADDPTDSDALLMLHRAACSAGSPEQAAAARHLAHALGIAPPDDDGEPPAGVGLALAEPVSLGDPLHETLRRLTYAARDSLAAALQTPEPVVPEPNGDAQASFRAAALAAEGDLASPALLPLATAEVGELVTQLATLCLDEDRVRGSGDRVNALAAELGRRQRRKLRRLLEGVGLEQVQGVDFAAWRGALRDLAAGVAVDRSGSGLRPALLVLLRDGAEPPPDSLPEHADLTPWLAACPPARELLGRAVRACLGEP